MNPYVLFIYGWLLFAMAIWSGKSAYYVGAIMMFGMSLAIQLK